MYLVSDPHNLPLITSFFEQRKNELEHALNKITAKQVIEIEAFDYTRNNLEHDFLFRPLHIWSPSIKDVEINPNRSLKQGDIFGYSEGNYMIKVEFEVTGSLELFGFYTKGVEIHGPSYKPKYGKFIIDILSNKQDKSALNEAMEEANKQLLQTKELAKGANESLHVFNHEMTNRIKLGLEKKREAFGK